MRVGAVLSDIADDVMTQKKKNAAIFAFGRTPQRTPHTHEVDAQQTVDPSSEYPGRSTLFFILLRKYSVARW